MYTIKEMYYTLQGEGFHTGRPAVFCRFSGCNLWSGREEDRANAICTFCDTEFRGTDGENGGRYRAETLVEKCIELWPATTKNRFVVCTGGEPLLQLDEDLCIAFREGGFEVAVETNGTQPVPAGIDWVCVSPKANTEVIVREGNELKLVFPQTGQSPNSFESWHFDHFFLQPMDGPMRLENTQLTIDYCLKHPKWKLSLQSHKFVGLK